MLNRCDLHPYQEKGVNFIIDRKQCALFLDMGLGKTATTLTAVTDMLDSFVIKRILVIAPIRVCNSVWHQESRKWDHLKHLRISICTGSAARRKAALNRKSDIYLINRENVQWLVEECKKFRKWPFDCVIVDESSSFKNPSAKRFKKLKTVLKHINVMVLLTGTPSPNGLLDLWSQMFLIDQGGALGKTMTKYKQRFFESDYFGYTWTPKEDSDRKIHALINHQVLSMSAKDYLEVPERIDIYERVQLPDAIMKSYREFKRDLLIELSTGQEVEAVNAAVLANKLLQYANGAIYTDDAGSWSEIHTVKLDTLSDIIDDNPNENILVAYNYKTDLIRLQKKFPSAEMLDKAGKNVSRWNNGEIKLLFAHPASCGHGINLQYGGSTIVWFGLSWSLELDMQMIARIHRQGQTRPVRVVRIVAEGTIDERVLSVLAGKECTQNDLIQALKEEFEDDCRQISG